MIKQILNKIKLYIKLNNSYNNLYEMMNYVYENKNFEDENNLREIKECLDRWKDKLVLTNNLIKWKKI